MTGHGAPSALRSATASARLLGTEISRRLRPFLAARRGLDSIMPTLPGTLTTGATRGPCVRTREALGKQRGRRCGRQTEAKQDVAPAGGATPPVFIVLLPDAGRQGTVGRGIRRHRLGEPQGSTLAQDRAGRAPPASTSRRGQAVSHDQNQGTGHEIYQG